jgi:hypothetical protein
LSKPPKPLEFYAYIPPIKSGLTFGGAGGEFSLKLEGTLHNSPDAARLMLFTGQRLKVTIESLSDLEQNPEKEPERVGRGRQLEES